MINYNLPNVSGEIIFRDNPGSDGDPEYPDVTDDDTYHIKMNQWVIRT